MRRPRLVLALLVVGILSALGYVFYDACTGGDPHSASCRTRNASLQQAMREAENPALTRRR